MATKTYSVKLNSIRIESGTTNVAFVDWTFSLDTKRRAKFKEYQVKWFYQIKNSDKWLPGDDGSISSYGTKISSYSLEDNAVRVKVWVKPVATTTKASKNGWTGASATKQAAVSSIDVPDKPSNVTHTLTNGKLEITATVSGAVSGVNSDLRVAFRVAQNMKTWMEAKGSASSVISANRATFVTPVLTEGYYYNYTVAVYNRTSKKYSEWTDWSEKIYAASTAPNAITVTMENQTTAKVVFYSLGKREGYQFDLTTKEEYFDTSETNVITLSETGNVEDLTPITKFLNNLSAGTTYYMRIRTYYGDSVSKWSEIVKFTLGRAPSAPTIWSNLYSAKKGMQDVILYWTHNTQDGSSWTEAELDLKIEDYNITDANGSYIRVVNENINDEFKKDKAGSYLISKDSFIWNNVLQYSNYNLNWRVRTRGAYAQGDNNGWSEWSTMKTVSFYETPTVTMGLYSGWIWDDLKFDYTPISSLEPFTGITKYPFIIPIKALPEAQTPITYVFTIKALESYDYVNLYGDDEIILKDQIVYEEIIDSSSHDISVILTPSKVVLKNDIQYLFKIEVYMDSGLTASDEHEVTTNYLDESNMVPDATIECDNDLYRMYISPSCTDLDTADILDNVTLDVYRINADKTLTEIGTDIPNNGTVVTDPHPSFNTSAYRIIARNQSTGEIAYEDLYTDDLTCSSVVINWDEKYDRYIDPDSSEALILPDDIGIGSMLELPFNIDRNESLASEVSLVSYVGRNYSVSYYGTHKEIPVTINTDVVKEDADTISLLRALGLYAGDVYFRDPSGLGYWANTSVSFKDTHCELVIPVTITITKVEGDK